MSKKPGTTNVAMFDSHVSMCNSLALGLSQLRCASSMSALHDTAAIACTLIVEH